MNPSIANLFNRRLRTLALLFLLAGSVAAQEGLLSRGSQALRDGDSEKAYRLFSQAAKNGDRVGQYGMGVLYFQGKGVPADLQESTRWFRLAAENGYAPAQYNLGNAFLHGRGVKKDLQAAEIWWQKAARQGYARAQYNLGSLLLRTSNNKQERIEQGIAWYRSAAERGFDKAENKLTELDEPVRFSRIRQEASREPLRSEARLLTLNPKTFTIQMFSGRQPVSAQRFIRQHQLAGHALRFRFSGKDAIWTGVVFGSYDSREEAGSVIDGLKPSLKKIGPWVRPVSDIHAQIRQARIRSKR